MSAVVKELDNRFTAREMIAATALQETGIGKLQERMAESHKLLITHYNKPIGVLIETDVFDGLIGYLRELESALEDVAEARLIDVRLAAPVADDEWLSEEQVEKAAKRLAGNQRGRR